ncbi:MAG: gliding motility-associated C-terminal domain-containing protein [Saprospiraceae bacterium]|nr:gliding motility-associated C-terminal domain-containing protein [Saprospiraceae bacterium]
MNLFLCRLTQQFTVLHRMASMTGRLRRGDSPPQSRGHQVVLSDYFTTNQFRPMRGALRKTALVIPVLLFAFAMQAQDLSVAMRSSVTSTTIGSSATFTIVVKNEGATAASGVAVTSPVPTGSTYVSDDGGGNYVNGTGVWTVGGIAAGDSALLNITVSIASEGVVFGQAEVTASGGADPDSTPSNGSVIEDDWSSACITVPMHYNCRDDINVLATAPTGYANYQWYLNGAPISGAIQDTYRIRGVGDYTFTAETMGTSCPTSLCCPITVVRDSCLSLGNLVFDDKDNDGKFNGADSGIDNVNVQLWSAGIDGLKGTNDDILDSTITTAGGGLYLFTNLNPGLYYVKLTGTGVPTGYVSSTGDGINDNDGAGNFEPGSSDESIDSDDNGTKMVGSPMIMSDTVRLTLNGEPISEDGSANSNLTIDFGLYKPVCVLPDIIAASPAAVCAPLTVDLSAITVTDNNNVTGGVSYYATAADAVAATNPLASTIISTSGTYWIRKEGSFAPCYDTVSVVVTINPKPVYADGSKTECEGTAVDLTSLVAGYGSIVNPTWTVSGNAVTTPTAVTPSVGTTTYQLIGENASGCKDTAEVVVTVNPLPNAGKDTLLVCNGAVAPTTYDFAQSGTWSVLTQPAGASANITSAGFASTMTVSGDYEYVLEINGCKDTVKVTIPACNCTSPDISAASPAAVCAPLTVDLASIVVTDAQGINGAISYYASASDAVAGTNALTSTVISTSGTYWIRMEGNAAPCYDTVSVVVTINPKPVYADGSKTECEGTAVDLTSLVAGYGSIVNPTWTVSGNAVTTPTAVTPSVGTTTYQLIGENASGCKDTAEVVVTVNPLPNAGKDTSLVCSGNMTPSTINFNQVGTWSVLTQPVGASALIDGNGNATGLTLGGQYTFELSINGCKDTVAVTVTPCVPTLSLGNLVWNDANNNGIKDATETGIPGVEVQLWNVGIDGAKGGGDDFLLTSQNTDTNGNYLFTGMTDGTYYVKLTGTGIPTGMVSSTGEGVNDTDGIGSFEPSTVVDVNEEDNGTAMGAMIMSQAVVLTLNTEPTNDGDTDPNTNLTVDFGLYTPIPLSSLGNLVWNDTNNNGLKDPTEGGIAGVEVVLYNLGTDGIKSVDDVAVDTFVTDATGHYLFTGLIAGDYYVKLSGLGVPTGMVSSTGDGIYDNDNAGAFEPSTSTADNTDNGSQMGVMIMSSITNLTAGEVDTTVDFGLYEPVLLSSLGNLVWNDANNNGIKDPTEGGIAGVEVVLYNLGTDGIKNGDDVALDTFVTDATGHYLFTGLIAGDYYVKLSGLGVPTGMVSSTGDGVYDNDNAGAFEPSTSTADNTDNGSQMGVMIMSSITNLTAGEVDTTVDFGLYEPVLLSSLGNLVWNDANNNGLKDPTEGGIAGVEVVLYNLGTDGIKSVDDVAVDTFVTDATGHYLFTGLIAGDYYVKLSGLGVPTGMVSSTGDGIYDNDNAGAFELSTSTADNTDNGSQMGAMIMSSITNLTAGEVDTAVDFGLYAPQCHPLDISAVSPAAICAPGVVDVAAIAVSEANNLSGVLSYYADPNDAAAGVNPLSNTVISTVGVTTIWIRKQDTSAIGSACWDTTSIVVTINAKPNLGGDVTLNCVGNSTPSAYDFATTGIWTIQSQPVGATALITSAGAASGMTVNGTYCFEIDVNGCKDTVKVVVNGCLPTLSLGNVVWNDANNNGVKDATESGLANVAVELWNVGLDGVKGTNDDLLLTAQNTDNAGNYLFTGMTDGTYYVKLTGAGIPPGFISSTGDGVSDNDGAGTYEPSTVVDENEKDNGTTMIGTTMVMSQAIVMSLNGEPVNDGDTDPNTNLTVDFGFYFPVFPPDTLYVSVPIDSTTNPLCVTADDLTNVSSVVATTCEPDGQTDFGTYTTDVNNCVIYTAGHIAGNTVDTICIVATDSLGRKDTTVWIITITPKSSLGNVVWNDANNNGIKDPTEGGIAGVEVVLYNLGTDGVKSGDDQVVKTTVTDANGNYLFGGLDAGDYYVKLSGTGVPSGMVSSTGDGVNDTDGAGAFEPSTSTADNTDNGTEMGAMVMSSITNLTQGEVDTTVDFGLYKPILTPDTLYVSVPVDSTTQGLCATGDDLRNIGSVVVTTCEPDGQTDFGTWTTNAQGCAVYTAGTVPGSHVDTLCVVATDSLGRKDTTVWIITITPKLSIGNLVWLDENNNGVKDATENGLGGIEVILYSSVDGTKGNGDDVAVDTLTTDVNGNYLFTGLTAGNYWVKLNNVPSILVSSTGDGIYDNDGAGAFEPSTTVDQNNTDNGTSMGTMVMSQMVVLATNSEPTNDDDTDANTNTTVDFGLYTPQTLPTLTLGNLVWLDTNNNGTKDANESGLSNVEVILYSTTDAVKGNGDDVAVDTLITDINGNYLFTGLAAGNYWVKLNNVPSGLKSSTGDGPTDNDGAGTYEPSTVVDANETDNGTAMGAMVMSQIVNLALYGEPVNDGDTSSLTNLTVDFGLYVPQAIACDCPTRQDTIAPILVGVPANVTVECSNVPSEPVVTATDNCTTSPRVTFYEIRTNGACPDYYTLTRTWTATDNCGNTATASQLITVRDITKPVLVGVPANVTVECTNVPTAPTVGATDNCDANVSVAMVELRTNGSCPDSYTLTRTWTATDNCGNTATASQVVTVRDTTKPVFANVPANVTLSCPATMPTALPTASDNCDTNVRITMTDQTTPGNCSGNYVVTRTWTAEDNCGNTSTAQQIITVKDTVAPTLVGVPANVTLNCGQAVPTVPSVSATDTCDASPHVNFAEVTNGAVITRTWTATDACGNTATAAQTITIPNCNVLSLGNIVWRDTDNNGIKDGNEQGIANVEVILYATTDTIKGNGDDVAVDTLLTDINGNYLFSGLAAGQYWVKLTGVGLPSGFISSTGDGPFDADGAGAFEPSTEGDVNERDHGTQMGAMVMSKIVDLALNSEPTNDGDADANTNLTVDFGIYKPTPLPTLSIGNLVWLDANNNGIKDATETGLSGVKVILYNAGNNGIKGGGDDFIVDSLITDVNGNYLFAGLNEGSFYVKLTGLPSNLVSSTGDGPYDADNSGAFEPSTEGDVNERDHGTGMIGTGMVMSNVVVLTRYAEPTNDGDTDSNTNLTVDFGLYTPGIQPVFDLALTKKLAPRPRGVVVNNGNVVRFDITVYNQGNVDAYDVKITDYVPTGLQFTTAANTAALTGNANNWQADSTLIVGNIAAGQSKVVGIFLTVNHAPNDTIFVNKAEISFATDTQGSGNNTLDVDSRADNNPNNDIVGGDDIINNYRNDEDDHDFAYVIDYIDHDPIGYIYCDKTGKLVTGGQISVTGPGLVFYIERGETGRYQFYTDGTPGAYTISYTHPDGYPMSSICLPQADTLNTATADGSSIDKDGVANGISVIGEGANNSYLLDKTCSNNPYYLTINITSGADPIVLNNNLPIQCSFIGALTCKDNNYNSIIDAGDTRFDSVKVYLLNCTTLAVIDSTISVNGQYRFDGLRNGSYRIRAELPNGYRFSIANVGGNELVDSDVDSLGYSACINLQFGECDTSTAQICMIPNIYELNLRKTLAAGQSSTVGVGDTVTFDIKVRNTGSMDAYDVDVTDSLPSHLTLIDNNWTLVGSNAVRRIPFIRFGDSATVSIRTRVNAQTTSILNTASVRGSSRPNGPIEGESTLSNNRDSVRINVRACVLTPDFVMSNTCATEGADFDVLGSYATWSWNFGDGATSTVENPTHIYQVGGTYNVTLTVTDGNGCTGTITKQVIIHPMVWAYAGIDRTICEGDSVHLHTQGGTHYLWLTGTSSLDDTISANPIARPSVTTTYVVSVSNDYGCTTLDTVVVNVVPKPIIVSRTGNLSTCTNGTMPVSITLNQNITSYEIVGSAGWRNVVVNGATITFDAVLNGSYNNLRVILRGTNGCSVTDEFNLYLAGNPKADFVAIEPFCNGNDITLLFTGQATPGANLTYTNNDGGVVVYRSAATATRPAGDTTIIRFPDLGSKLITLTVNDGGCIDTKVQSIYVRKTPVVTITTPDRTICPNTCVQLTATTTLPGMIMWTANQTPSGLSATDILNPIACPTQTTTYVLTVMEAGGCMGRDTVTITVNNNVPVLIGVPANVTVACGSVPAPATVTEQYGAIVRFAETRTDGNCPGNYILTRTWTATDSCNRTVTGTQIITVQDIIAPTLANAPANVTVTCVTDVPVAVILSATDACDNAPVVRSTDVISNETCVNRKTITRTWTATDACGNTSTVAQVITVNDNVAPVLSGVPANVTVTCLAEVPVAPTVTATDNCTGATPTVVPSEVVSNETCVNRKTITRTWTATDACGNTATGVQIITVNDNVPPVLADVPANVTITCNGDMPTAPTVTATDNCTGGTPTVRMTEATTNEVCANRKTVTRTWTATDACGNTATASQVITVNDNIVPVFTSVPADITLNCDETQPNILAVATDNCGTPTIRVNNSTSGSGCNYTILRVFTATDACGNSAQATQTITVRDTKAPVITNVPANTTVDCETNIPAIGTPSVSDACDQSPRLTMTQTTTDSTCYSRKTVVRTWTATDACGNTSTASQTIRVNDNIAPVITPTNPRLVGLHSGDTLTMSCEDIRIFQMGDATAVDNCDGVLTPNTTRFRFEDLARHRGNCLTDGYSLLIECRWYAVDRCGNESEWRIFLKVTDNSAPVMSGCPADVTVASPSAIPTAPTVTATDNCTDTVQVIMTEVTTPTGNNCDYTITRTWTATDACGNFSTCRQIITVKDSIDVKFVWTDVTCTGNDGTITMIPTQGLTYAWSDGGTGAYRTRLSAGTYTVTATRGTCQKVLTVTVGTNCNCVTPVASVQKVDATCGNANGTATIAVDNAANYTFTWSSGGNSTNNRTGLAAGNYSVTVSRNGVPNCSTVVTFTIGNNTQNCCTPPTASIQKTDATCGSANGTATVVVDNTANYTYAWNDGNTSSSRTGLAAGNYTVTVSRIGIANCSTVVSVTIGNNTANCCSDFIAQTSVVKVITDCNGTGDVCVEIPTIDIVSYTITDNGTAYTGGFGTCLAGSTLRFTTGDHIVIFTSPSGCKDTLAVKVVCTPEQVINRTVTFPQTDSTCLTAAQLGLTGNIISVVNECAGSENNTQITINQLTGCISYKSLSIGVDTACLRVTTSTGGSALVKFIITVNLPGCGSIIPQDSVLVTNACGANPKVCVNIPFDVIPDYDILLNDATYTGGLDGCKNDTSFAYTYFTVPGRGATGPYSLDYWTVNGVVYTAPTVNNMDELVALMNAWDPTGHWMLSSSTLTIVGGDRRKTYGGIKITRLSNGSYGIMELNTNIIPLATELEIPRGQSTLVFINHNTGCADTLRINAACLTPQYVESSMYIGDKDTLCIATNELMGTRYRLTKLVPSTNTYARFSDLAGTTCVSRLGVAVGVEKATYVVSDEFGFNDTTYVTTYVYARSVKRPVANIDHASTIKAKPVLIDVLSNDSLNTNGGKINIVSKPKHGEVVVTSDFRIIYTPEVNFCSSTPDAFTYELCTAGGCDTAKVEVTVTCDKIKIYNGFSPNGDGLNDNFVIEGIENFPNNSISVYNRWGTEVMKTKGYKNDWNGKWDGVDLPDGTYFYIFNDGEGNIKSGYVQIQR